MAKAIWNDTVVAESDTYEIVEGNVYFPRDTIKLEYFKPSDSHTTCHWKGVASYYNLEINGKTNNNAAWYYPNPSEAAHNIKDYVAFWQGVKVTRD